MLLTLLPGVSSKLGPSSNCLKVERALVNRNPLVTVARCMSAPDLIYPFRRGAAVLVHSACRWDQISGQWVAEDGQTRDIAQLRHLLIQRGFQIVLEVGPGTAVPRPCIDAIRTQMDSLTNEWRWGCLNNHSSPCQILFGC